MSSETPQSNKRIITDLKYPLPDVRVSFENQLDIIKAYVVASNNGKDPVGYKELENFVKVDSTMISGCNKFFQHMGIISVTEKSGKYLPTEIALELSNSIKWKNESLIKSTLRKILEQSWFWTYTKQLLEVNDSITKKVLIEKLGMVCGGDPDKHIRAIEKLIEYLQYAELIKDEDGNISSNNSLLTENNYTPTPQIAEQPKNELSVPFVGKLTSVSTSNNITLSIMITPEMSEEQIRKTIRIVLDEIKNIQSEQRE